MNPTDFDRSSCSRRSFSFANCFSRGTYPRDFENREAEGGVILEETNAPKSPSFGELTMVDVLGLEEMKLVGESILGDDHGREGMKLVSVWIAAKVGDMKGELEEPVSGESAEVSG